MKKELFFYLGTYSRPILFGTGEILNGKGEGIHLFSLAPDGTMTNHGVTVACDNPSYLAVNGDYSRLYCVNELKEYNGKKTGAVTAFSVNKDRTLTALNTQETNGTDPCHLAIDSKATLLFAANFMSGSVSAHRILPDGSLGERTDFKQHEGASIHPKRQTGPHAHATILDGSEQYVFVPDLGIDRTVVYRVDAAGKLTEGESIPSAKGAGPRQCVFSKDGTRCYIINELNATIDVVDFDAKTGVSTILQTAPMIEGEIGNTICADIRLHPSGKFLYAVRERCGSYLHVQD